MREEKVRARKSYSLEFKRQAVELAAELGTRKAAVKLGIPSPNTLAAWFRHRRRLDEDERFRTVEELRRELKRTRRELEESRKNEAILRDAAAFFCRESQK